MVYLILTFISILIIFFLSIWLTFTFSHKVVRPLRKLNDKMDEILNMSDVDVEINQHEETSSEITTLYEVFKQLIQDRKF